MGEVFFLLTRPLMGDPITFDHLNRTVFKIERAGDVVNKK